MEAGLGRTQRSAAPPAQGEERLPPVRGQKHPLTHLNVCVWVHGFVCKAGSDTRGV